jgi:hypothetical protein
MKRLWWFIKNQISTTIATSRKFTGSSGARAALSYLLVRCKTAPRASALELATALTTLAAPAHNVS